MFGHDLDWWNTVMLSFLGIGAVAAVIVVVAQALIIKLQAIESADAKKALEQYKISAEADADIKINAARDEARTQDNILEKATADANKAAEEANERAKHLESENLKLSAQIQPRRLTQDQENGILRALSASNFGYFKKKVAIVSYAFDVESSALVAKIMDLGYHAHFNIEKLDVPLGIGGAFFSVSITGSDESLVTALLKSLDTIGHIEVTPNPVFKGFLTPGALDNIAADATVFVGAKPLPK